VAKRTAGRWLKAIAAPALIAVFLVAVASSAATHRAGPEPKNGAAAETEPTGLENEQEIREELVRDFIVQHSDSSGELRADLWRKGVRQLRAREHVGLGGKAAPATASQWTQIGSAPLRIDPFVGGGAVDPNLLFQGTGPDSGLVADIAVSPAGGSDSVAYIAPDDGGVWKTTDGGTSWTPLTDSMPSNSIGALALDPANPSIVYAGTGSPDNNGFMKAVGIYRSANGGASW
jgi:hypothetical protein